MPVASVEVSVDRSSESLKLAEMAKSKLLFGAASNSTSTPWLRAFGTLKMTRDEHEPGGDGRLQVVDVHVEAGRR